MTKHSEKHRAFLALTVLLTLTIGPEHAAMAHWCSNIFASHARLVVKPEKSTLYLSSGAPATLKVYLRNNFPYKLFNMRMRGEASGYNVDVSPGDQDVHPGQNVAYTFSITDSAGTTGDIQVSTLNLQVRMRLGDWRGQDDRFVNQSPSQGNLIDASDYGSSQGEQASSLNAATLADLYPSATIPSMLNRSGLEQLIHWFGYRFCYNTSGDYRCGSQNCPDPCAVQSSWHWSSIEQFPQNCMRAGVDLAIRKHKLGSLMQQAQDAAVNAMKGSGSGEHKCLASVVGGYLWQAASSTTTFEAALDEVSGPCKAAGLRALGKGSPSNCSGGTYYEQASCAAAEGLQGNDDPVKNILMVNAGDGDSGNGYQSLYYSYMLYLVTGDRREVQGEPSYYPQVGPAPGPGPGSDAGVGAPGSDSSPGGTPSFPSDAGAGGQLPLVTSPTEDPSQTLGPSNILEGGCSYSMGPLGPLGSAIFLLGLLGLLLLALRRDL